MTHDVFLTNPDGPTAQEITIKSIHEQAAALADEKLKTWREQAQKDMEHIRDMYLTRFYEVEPDVYQTQVSLGGYQATIYMSRRRGNYWAQVRNARKDEDISSAYFDTLRDAAQWSVWEISEASRTSR